MGDVTGRTATPKGAKSAFWIMFGFMLLHQADKLLIGPLTTQIMETFQITRTQMGAVSTGALVVGAICYPLWGWLYDRFSRPKLLALAFGASFGWRNVFFLTGGLGLLLSAVIFLFVKDRPRGAAEPELAAAEHLERFAFSWKTVGGIFRKKSLVILLLQGFIGVFPWNVITYWIFDYLKSERGYDDTQTMLTMVPAVLIMAAGYPIGGILGDRLFKRTPKGRVIIGSAGVALGCVLLWVAIKVPVDAKLAFGVALSAAALFIPWASPNVLSSFYDVTEPEIRATTNAVQNFVEFGGSALAPLLAGIIADRSSLGYAILLICPLSWVACFAFFIFAGRYIPKDIEDLKDKLKERAA